MCMFYVERHIDDEGFATPPSLGGNRKRDAAQLPAGDSFKKASELGRYLRADVAEPQGSTLPLASRRLKLPEKFDRRCFEGPRRTVRRDARQMKFIAAALFDLLTGCPDRTWNRPTVGHVGAHLSMG
ncbi:MAG: hypothetical protein NVSMB42_07660 [Herpetosiphon sp.]